jgi:hypothetical protein
MKNNTNNNIVELTTFGYVYDSTTKLVYPMLKKGGYCTHESETILEFYERVRASDMPLDDFDAILELGDIDVNYALWKADNVIKRGDKFSTQCTLYRNLLTESELKGYFINSFCDESVVLKWEIETSGKWIQIFHDLYINIDSGYFSNGEEIYDTCIDDANAIEYFEQMSAVDLETLSRYFPKVISKYKDTYTRALCREIYERIEEGDYGIALNLVEQISAMTRG